MDSIARLREMENSNKCLCFVNYAPHGSGNCFCFWFWLRVHQTVWKHLPLPAGDVVKLVWKATKHEEIPIAKLHSWRLKQSVLFRAGQLCASDVAGFCFVAMQLETNRSAAMNVRTKNIFDTSHSLFQTPRTTSPLAIKSKRKCYAFDTSAVKCMSIILLVHWTKFVSIGWSNLSRSLTWQKFPWTFFFPKCICKHLSLTSAWKQCCLAGVMKLPHEFREFHCSSNETKSSFLAKLQLPNLPGIQVKISSSE